MFDLGPRLRPCPFYGSTDVTTGGWHTGRGIETCVKCNSCQAQGSMDLDADKAVAAWQEAKRD